MALEERDREDLLRDGRMMPWRGECSIDGVTVLAGFRRDQQLSLYCGPDPVFQFNSAGKLRRAYVDGRRLTARQGLLVELKRSSRGGKVELESHEIDAASEAEILLLAAAWVRRIRVRLTGSDDHWRVVGEEPRAFRDRLLRWIDAGGDPIAIADEPNT